MQRIPESELILNDDGSIYHLNLLPEDIANTIITVGDPDRVDHVTQYFDSISVTKQRREFKTVTGVYKNKPITVISTGIGTDNIDIVFNELDALVNVDLKTRYIKEQHTTLDIIRIGTSGAIQKDIPVDSFLLSSLSVGFDSLLHFYKSDSIQDKEIAKALMKQIEWSEEKSNPYVVSSDASLSNYFKSSNVIEGFTATNVGFYGPQSRTLRLPLQDAYLNDKLSDFKLNELRVTNLEMETAGIYGMAKLLGHRAVSMNAILANRPNHVFSNKSQETIDKLIQYCLNVIADI